MSEDADEAGRDFVTALARGLDVLQVCAAHPDGVTLSDVARQTGLPRASVRRSLLTLCATGYLVADGRAFVLTPKVLSFSAAIANSTLARLAQPVLDGLNRQFGESFSLATLDGTDVLYVARSEARRIFSLNLSVGSRLPAYCTSMGRVLLAGLAAEALERALPRELPARTPRTITDRQELLRALDEVRRVGFCLLDQELELGLRSLAVPLIDTNGHVVAALNVGVQAAQMPARELRRLFLSALQQAADTLRPATMRLP
ncbi:IclR family transcriptional regulator domain-containing protein [Rhizosaccharibacter radicis]|uniref:Helix-turn-helix domain-containing protein n=1 Tax=Rhizosaccharibacter radicis TaxID=2782605 RepID=A0ABT1W0T8_9PROT|nr:helix-turn-helix domain-containing protein [Acetobacteraceae bacterium KSS12]